MALSESEIAAIVSQVVAELREPVVTPAAVNYGVISVSPGDTILADHINSLGQQAVPKFANAAARDASWPSRPDGAICWLEDVNYFEVYSDSIVSATKVWHPIGGLRMGYATMGTSQSIPNGVSTWTQVKLTLAGGAANKLGRSQWTADGNVSVPIAGTYLVTCRCVWPANNTGERRLATLKRTTANVVTSSGVGGGVIEQMGASAGGMNQSTSAMVAAGIGEKIGMYVQQNSGGPLVMPAGGTMAVQLLGAD